MKITDTERLEFLLRGPGVAIYPGPNGAMHYAVNRDEIDAAMRRESHKKAR